MTLMALELQSESQSGESDRAVPPPAGCILCYPAIDMSINSWMTDEQVQLIREGTRSSRSGAGARWRGRHPTRTAAATAATAADANEAVLRRKSEEYHKLTPATSRANSPFAPHERRSELELEFERRASSLARHQQAAKSQSQSHSHPTAVPALRTRLAMSSMISYFNDRILTPEMMRAMIILYIGPYHRPDFASDYLLSPILAPDVLLARFPRTYILTGERDPLVDDTVIFAGRIRQARARAVKRRVGDQSGGDADSDADSDCEDSTDSYSDSHVMTTLLPGVSHGFMQLVPLYHPAWELIERCAGWIRDIYEEQDAGRRRQQEREQERERGIGREMERKRERERERDQQKQWKSAQRT
ncbi:hypothetical protein KEM52_003777, partial [Ascosphaera acerosa]